MAVWVGQLVGNLAGKPASHKELHMNIWTGALGIHEQALEVRSQRMEVIAQNIANADTPHYKARDIDFKAVLQGVADQDLRMAATQPGHLPVAEALHANGMRFRTPFNTSFDGNTVELSVEQAQYGKAAADYQASLHFLENRISGLRKALRGE
jgi:flagellar basal-body rod protein FlgB